ncbi:MAG: carbohydrate binding domain-containing protein [Sedimentisphaerales bacterium]|nr:carbohydrate binding domain-containing protein [Sedimentisphaerales bacterium]
MKYHKHSGSICSNTISKCLRQFVILVLLISFIVCPVSAAGEMVPFVIPAKSNPDSLIAFTSIEPIGTDSEYIDAVTGHFYRDGERIRLWGVNLSFGASMPSHEDAPFIAARLAAAGVNTVRCHHMDTSRRPRGLWNAKDGKTISPEALDRLDYFIDQLARNGIFANINLHVGRAHSEYLGLPKANRQYDKISNIFTPALIDAQKKFARQLLTHVNPYRKVRYADDPAVAFVEITNENSFFMWDNENTLRTLGSYYADILQEKYNSWLKKRYGSDEKLRDIWSEGAEHLGKNLLDNSSLKMTTPDREVPTSWNLEQHSGCKASLSLKRYESKNALSITIDKADETEWHLQLNQGGISLKEGRYYTVIFEAAADEPRKMSCSVSQAHSPWSNLGLSRQVELKRQWQEFRFGFVAKADDENGRLSFAFGKDEIPFYLANIRFHSGGRISLLKGESLETENIVVFADNESPNRTLDRMMFLAEMEKAYFDEMRNFVKNDLGCKALVTGTIVFGPLGLYAQSDMDFIDVHAYWQHPRFPGRPWDSGNWLIEQKSMTDYPAEATLFRLAACRLEGKPFTLSEYNHPAPLDSQAECVPMAASFAAAQDWDAIWFYTYSHSSDDWYRENLNSFFDIDTNPAKWGFMRAGAAIFREGLVQPLGESVRAKLFLRSNDSIAELAQLHLKHDRDMMDVVSDICGVTRQGILSNKLFVSFRPAAGTGDNLPSRVSLRWSVEDGRGGYFVGSGAGVLAGDTSRFERCRIDEPEFAVITATPLDGLPWPRSSRILITACGRCENTDMEFSKDRRTVGRRWGSGPVRIETVKGTVEIPGGSWTAQALGPDGLVKADVLVRCEGERNFMEMSPKYKTMWYLLKQN